MEDKKFFVEKGDPGFSPARNKAIIEGTIRKRNQEIAARRKAYQNDVAERSDAVATYLRSRAAEGYTPLEKYFGKRQLAHLRGQKIVQVLKGYFKNDPTKPIYELDEIK